MTHTAPEPRHEPRDIDSFGVAFLGGLLVLGLILATLVCALFYQMVGLRAREREGPLLSPLPERAEAFPHPRLQASPASEWRAFRQKEEAALSSYEWIDRPRGIVQIPIGRAMERLLERGLPTGEAVGPTWEEMMRRRAAGGGR